MAHLGVLKSNTAKDMRAEPPCQQNLNHDGAPGRTFVEGKYEDPECREVAEWVKVEVSFMPTFDLEAPEHGRASESGVRPLTLESPPRILRS